MKPSLYNLFSFDYQPLGPGVHLVYNGLSQAVVGVNDALLEAAWGFCVTGILPEGDLGNDVRTFIKQGFLVEDKVDEPAIIEARTRNVDGQGGVLSIMVLTTMQCNMSCVYCVEEGVKSDTHMDPDMTEAVIRWLETKIRETKPVIVRMDFYGGEPLLNTAPIEQICEYGQCVREKYKIPFHARITTAGVLLTPDVAVHLAEIGVTSAKITLDGDESHHNAKRSLRGGQGTYAKILENITGIVERLPPNKFGVMVGCNLDVNNVNSVPAMLDDLARRGLKKKLYMIDFSPVCPTLSNGEYGYAGCSGLNDEVRAMTLARLEAIKRGFQVPMILGTANCGMSSGNFFIIDPTGVFYTCPALVGRSEYSVGTITDNGSSPKRVEHLAMRDLVVRDPDCRACKFAANCNAGCRYLALVSHNELAVKYCKKDELEYNEKLLVATHYEVQTKELESVENPNAY